MTYAAILGAKTVVWVAPESNDEHRKTLDWLNDNTGEELSFFGIQVELWSIDGSRPAVRFAVISRPADIVRQGQIAKSGAQQARVIDSPRSPRPQYWYDVPLGRAGLHLSLIASPDERRLGVRVYLRNKNGGQVAYRQLLQSKEAIEKARFSARVEPERGRHRQDYRLVSRSGSAESRLLAWASRLDGQDDEPVS